VHLGLQLDVVSKANMADVFALALKCNGQTIVRMSAQPVWSWAQFLPSTLTPNPPLSHKTPAWRPCPTARARLDRRSQKCGKRHRGSGCGVGTFTVGTRRRWRSRHWWSGGDQTPQV